LRNSADSQTVYYYRQTDLLNLLHVAVTVSFDASSWSALVSKDYQSDGCYIRCTLMAGDGYGCYEEWRRNGACNHTAAIVLMATNYRHHIIIIIIIIIGIKIL